MGRACVLVIAEVIEILTSATLPVTITAVIPSVIGIDRVIAAAAGVP
jgi:hypothetical protein